MFIALAVIGLICAVIAGAIAHRKGLSVPLFAVLGLVISWVGVIIALLARPSAERRAEREMSRVDEDLEAAKARILGRDRPST